MKTITLYCLDCNSVYTLPELDSLAVTACPCCGSIDLVADSPNDPPQKDTWENLDFNLDYWPESA